MPQDHYRPKILMVDDRRENLVALQRILAPLAAELIAATSGNEALALTIDHHFAVILLDVMMPEMDGFETAELLRQNASTKHIPIIFVTAIGKDEQHIFKGYEAGAVDYLFKPLAPNILLSKVRVFLELHSQRTALDQANAELRRANERILAQQKSLIEEERLNVLLQMAGATAHELSQPLTALLFGINMLTMDKNDPEKTTRHIADIHKAGQRISEIVKKIRTLNRYEVTPHDREHDIIRLDQTLRILLIEADAALAGRIGEMLAEVNVALTMTASLTEGAEAFRQGSFDMIFLDSLLPDGTGQEFLAGLGTLAQEVPVVVLTGRDDAVAAAQLLRAGVYDYLDKESLTPQALKRVLAATMEKLRLHQEVQRTKARMVEMLNIDQLTGICSRQQFLRVLEVEFERTRRYGSTLAVLLMGIDGLRQINENHGHAAGDLVLSRMGQLLLTNKRCNDETCRYGGDKFTLLLPNASEGDARLVAEKLLRLVAVESFAGGNSIPFSVTTSIGLAVTGTAASPDELLHQAKEALEAAKTAGRNRVAAFDENGDGHSAPDGHGGGQRQERK